MAEAAPDRIIDAQGIIFETPNPAHRSVTADEAPLLNVLCTNSPAAKLADGSRFLFALDAFHGVGRSIKCPHPFWQNNNGARKLMASHAQPSMVSAPRTRPRLRVFFLEREKRAKTPMFCGIYLKNALQLPSPVLASSKTLCIEPRQF
jgi:hypothetical protein